MIASLAGFTLFFATADDESTVSLVGLGVGVTALSAAMIAWAFKSSRSPY